MNNNPISLDDLKDEKIITEGNENETNMDISTGNGIVETDGADESTIDITSNTVHTPTQHTAVDVSDIRQYSAPAAKPPTIVDEMYDKLDVAMEKAKVEAGKRIAIAAEYVNNQIEEDSLKRAEDAEAALNRINAAEDNVVDVLAALNEDSPKPTIKINRSNSGTVNTDSDIDKESEEDNININKIFNAVEDDDFFKDSEEVVDSSDEAAKVEAEAQFEQAKKNISQKIVAINSNKKIDLTTFTIRQKPISINRVLNDLTPTELKKADWVLWTAKRSFTMSELSGPDIEKLNVQETGRNNLNALMDLYRIFYDHIIDAAKPSFESWLKITPFLDVQHLYFAAYRASFGPDNAVPYNCLEEKCNEVFVENIPFDDMVKYKDESVKKMINNIFDTDTTSANNDYEVELLQISDDIVIAMKNPSIYNVVFEMAALTDDIRSKYSDMLSVMSYIDNIYKIDRDTNELAPIDTKPDPKNATKTVTRKVKAYYTILKTLTSDQYFNLAGYIKKIQDPATDITYRMPSITCPKCGKVIPESSHNSNELLFTRHQLGAIASM